MPKHRQTLALILGIAILAAAAPLHGEPLLDAAKRHTNATQVRPAGQLTPTFMFPYTDTDTREEQIRSMRIRQQRAGAALLAAGVPSGIMLARSRNEWNPIDEGWIGLGMAAASLATGLFAILEPRSWRTTNTATRIHATEGATARRLRRGRGAGAALSIGW